MMKTLKKPRSKRAVYPVRQEPLPYPQNSLSPYLSSRTIGFHYGKHHLAYIEKTNELIRGTDFEGLTLERILLKAYGRTDSKPLFNSAAQAWNHSFYWKSMKPGGGGTPGHDLLSLIRNSFGGLVEFKNQFETAAVSHFGSGWVWLVKGHGGLEILTTHDADNPMTGRKTPLLAFDVWEHAYYLDYQNRRSEYAKVFLDHLIHWGFAERNL